MGDRQPRPVASSMHRLQIEPFVFTANSASAPAESTFRGSIESVTRTGVGTFEVLMKEAFRTYYGALPSVITTGGTKAVVKSVNLDTRIVTVETRKASAVASQVPAYTAGVVVTTHVATLAVAGYVLCVEATAGSSAGVKTIITTGTPGDGQVKVVYTDGVATLTFDTSDAVTAATVLILGTGPTAAYSSLVVASHTVTMSGLVGYVAAVEATAASATGPKAIITTGTPGDGQVKVTYASGVPTLLFDTSDAVTAASVLFIPADVVSEPVVDTTDQVAFTLLVSKSATAIR